MNINNDTIESLVKRYVLGQLSDNETEEFEAYFLSRPEIIAMVEDVQRIHAGLEYNELSSEQPAGEASPSEGTISRWFSIFSGPVPAMAMLVLVAVMAPLAMQGLSGGGNQALDAQLVRLDSSNVRSSGSTGTYDLNAGGKHAAVIVRVKEVEYPEYLLRVNSPESNSELWESEKFSFASGARDYLVLVPPQAAIQNVDVQLLGIKEDAQQVEVDFCSYTEACF